MALTPEEATALLWKRACERLTPEVIAGPHKPQLAALLCTADSQIWIGSRQMGKTQGIQGVLWETAKKTPNVSCLYIGLTLHAVRKVWTRRWKVLLRKYDIPCSHNETELTTTFPNGSVVTFASTDDIGHVATLLGDSMAGGVAVIDESQDQAKKEKVLEYLVEDVLEPMLSQTTAEKPTPGKLILIGTIPDSPAGYWWDKFAKGLDADEIKEGRFLRPHNDNNGADADGWARLTWNRFDNPFFKDPQEDLKRSLRRSGKSEDDPSIQRDWFGRWLFLSTNRAFHAFANHNVYKPAIAPWSVEIDLPPGKLIAAIPPPEIDCGAIALDPAQLHDRFAIEAIGWSSTKPIGVYHIAEWIAPKAANTITSQWQAVVLALKDHFPWILHLLRDAGSNSETVDLLWRQTKLFIKPVVKGPGSRKMGVDRCNDLFARGLAFVIEGSQLHEDLLKSKWSTAGRGQGKYVWSPDYHPDAADSYRYAIERYVETAPEVTNEDLSHLTPDQRYVRQAAKEAEATIKELYANPEKFDPIKDRAPISRPRLWGRR